MPRIRVTGIVREANRLRRALSAPMTASERDALAHKLQQSIQQIDGVLQRHGALPRHLPGPSRRAYEFLTRVDLTSAQLVEAPPAGVQPPARPESVSYRGLRAFLDHLLDDIALAVHSGKFNAAASLRVIRQTAQRLDYSMNRDKLLAEHLKPESRDLAGWFRYFSDQEAFNGYAGAVQRAQSILSKIPAARTGWQGPLLVHYRPSKYLYKWRVFRDATRLVLNTPAMTFDEQTLHGLSQQMLGHKRYWPAITAAMLGEPFQALAVELEAAAGIVERSRGMAHDLAESFERVNREYFSGSLPRPKLGWSATLTGAKFGHYDFIHDQVCVSGSLDRPDVPAFVIDSVMHHELLHKKHGFRWRGSRQRTHTPEFRAEEKTFMRYEEAARLLDGLVADAGKAFRLR